MPRPSNVVHVRPLIGTEWLMHNWQFVLWVALASALPLWLIVRRWRASSQRAQALFTFTHAESLRARGDAKSSLVHYDTVLKHSCPTQLVWRCHSGRSMALLSRGDTSLALADANKAIELAEELARQAQTQKEKLEKQLAAKAAAAASSSTSATAAPSPPPPSSDPDTDPFLSLPEVSLALLHYQRGLVLDAMRESAAALDDMRRAAALEPDLAFVTGYVARRELQQRVQGGKDDTEQGKSNNDSSGEADTKQRTVPVAATKQQA